MPPKIKDPELYALFKKYLKRHLREAVPPANVIATELGVKHMVPKIVQWLRREGFEFNKGQWIKVK